MTRLCLIGCGNITNRRHIPALQHLGRGVVEGVIGADPAAVKGTAQRLKLGNSAVIDPAMLITSQLEALPWFTQCDAVIIGTPPREHYAVARACLELGKDLLSEKPMTMDSAEAEALIALASDRQRILAVMHNFQFSRAALQLEKLIRSGALGTIVSFFQTQFTTRLRSLPRWYKDLPLGLFYDEASHFFYLLRKLGGEIEVLDAFGHRTADPADNTPLLMSVDMRAGGIPVHLTINFNAPVCEWLFVVSGTEKLAIFDMFRDVLIVLPNDGTHGAYEVLRNSALLTMHQWLGFMSSGLRLARGKLFWGVDQVIDRFLTATETRQIDPDISALRGLETVTAMNRVADLIQQRAGFGR